MLATYEEGLREQFLERMRAHATVWAFGSDEAGLTWTLRFTGASTLDAAWSELSLFGLLGQSEARIRPSAGSPSPAGRPSAAGPVTCSLPWACGSRRSCRRSANRSRRPATCSVCCWRSTPSSPPSRPAASPRSGPASAAPSDQRCGTPSSTCVGLAAVTARRTRLAHTARGGRRRHARRVELAAGLRRLPPGLCPARRVGRMAGHADRPPPRAR